MNSQNLCSPKAGSTSTDAAGFLRVEIKGLGDVPSFKTGKRGTWGRTKAGKLYARPITKKEHRAWMKKAVDSIAFQLLLALAKERETTLTVPSQPFSTASPGPVERFIESYDDVWRQNRRLNVSADPGTEPGATIIFELFTDDSPA